MSYNMAEHDAIKTSPFFANYGFHPRLTTEPALAHVVENAEQLAQRLANIKEVFVKKLDLAKLVMKDSADRHHRPAPAYKVGDMVLLNLKNLALAQPSRKFSPRWSSPMKVVRLVKDTSVELEIPDGLGKVFPVFSVSMVKPHVPSDVTEFPGRTQPPPPPDMIDGEKHYEVEATLDSRWYRRKFQYRIKWAGYDISDDMTWYPATDFTGPNATAREVAEEFHAKYPDKPKPGDTPLPAAVPRRRRR